MTERNPMPDVQNVAAMNVLKAFVKEGYQDVMLVVSDQFYLDWCAP